jgi:hypothetical protein
MKLILIFKKFILNLYLKKENLYFYYLKIIYKFFEFQKNILAVLFKSIFEWYSKNFNKQNFILDRGVYTLTEIVKLGVDLSYSLGVNFLLTIINFFIMLLTIQIDLFIKGFFIYQNPFLINLVKSFISLFFVSYALYLLPIRYNLLIILGYFSFYFGIVLVLLYKKQNKECFEFLG